MSESNGDDRKFKWVGTRPIRHDGIDKVTGRANYGADVSLPGMLHACVLRSTHAWSKPSSSAIPTSHSPRCCETNST